MTNMKPVPYWRTAHKRNSVRALIVGTVVPFAAGIWSSIPGSYVERLPLWLVLGISAAISGLGLIGAYTNQRSLRDE
ncbi:hypothetical protein BX589_12073 [Paraburkholderia fungorum]|jgi:hypothetical protein|uniref:DUF7940 domain-containing protein n=1 Tax=Paraburkholderia fungorum TaxID=134537 RepID=UPI000D07D718|nr:hypothetical protein [Paraburkholderia fungorum]PRZ51232.1 hypothetical protein BX589_12073 [Paraburkholderia fungorum]